MTFPILGWDIGGANIKAARLDSPTDPDPAPRLTVREQPFALWREPDRLPEVLQGIAAELGGAPRMAATMTAELADCFASKRQGVRAVLDALAAAFPDAELWIWGTDGRFRSPEIAGDEPLAVAAANWAATAAWIARSVPDALLVDVGSTTTDLIPVVGGQVAARGRTDPERLRSGELVYTGVLRTPVNAVVRRVPLSDGWHRVAAEHFAIAADAHLWLGRIAPEEYRCETPDGRGTSRGQVAARLARVVCADPEMLAPGDLSRIARCVWRAQRRDLVHAIRQVLGPLGDAAPRLALCAGSGARLARSAARRAGLEVGTLDDRLGAGAVASAPAAVALLLAEQEPR